MPFLCSESKWNVDREFIVFPGDYKQKQWTTIIKYWKIPSQGWKNSDIFVQCLFMKAGHFFAAHPDSGSKHAIATLLKTQ